jgi:hypothetical protein
VQHRRFINRCTVGQQAVIDHCLQDPEHISACWSVLKQRLRTKADRVSDVADGECFSVDSQLGFICPKWKTHFLASISDMSVLELAKAKEIDKDALDLLLVYGLQLSLTLKLPAACRVKNVLFDVLQKRHSIVGQRLQSFKTRGGLKSDFRLNFGLAGCYSIRFDADGNATHVDHISSESVEVTIKGMITRDYLFSSNWSDVNAYTQLEPLPQFCLSKLFAVGVGPHKYIKIEGGVQPHFDDAVKKAHATWLALKSSVSFATETKDTDAIFDASTTKRKAKLAESREVAKVALKSRKQARTTDLRLPAAAASSTG